MAGTAHTYSGHISHQALNSALRRVVPQNCARPHPPAPSSPHTGRRLGHLEVGLRDIRAKVVPQPRLQLRVAAELPAKGVWAGLGVHNCKEKLVVRPACCRTVGRCRPANKGPASSLQRVSHKQSTPQPYNLAPALNTHPPATACIVTSSRVGPSPPEVITASCDSDSDLISAAMAATSSRSITTCRGWMGSGAGGFPQLQLRAYSAVHTRSTTQ